MVQKVFRRTETKYILSSKVYQKLLASIEPHLKPDTYFSSTNCSLYFDTEHFYLAVHSVESPMYKEKVRLRSYGIPSASDTVFLEIKKKYNGIGNKRRIPIKLSDFQNFQEHKCRHLITDNPQIATEAEYYFRHYKLRPALFIAYDRLSYCSKDDPSFRITFDSNLRSRTDNLCLDSDASGEPYFTNGEIIMEVKALNAYPLWFASALSRLKIYPAKFSKYGRVVQQLICLEKINI